VRRAAARGLALARSIFDLESSAIGLRLQPALIGHKRALSGVSFAVMPQA